MEATGAGQGGTVFARSCVAFDEGDDEQLWRLDPKLIMDEIALGQKFLHRVNGTLLRLIAHAEAIGPGDDQAGWSTANALAESQPQALRTAKATVLLATELAEHDQVAAALRAGEMSIDQARVVLHGLKGDMPDTCTVAQAERVERELVEHAKTFDPSALRRIANRLIEVTCPDAVADRLGTLLEREAAQACRDRYLNWSSTGRGSVDLRGRLPVVEGEALIAVLSAHAEAGKGALDRLDPNTVAPTLAQRRADALGTVITRHQQAQLAPEQGGDRSRVMITMAYQDLLAGLKGATLTGTCDSISPSEARRLACDADLIPAVLGDGSAALDVGRKHRLFTGELRHALVLRDGGCAFPACDRPARDCEGPPHRPVVVRRQHQPEQRRAVLPASSPHRRARPERPTRRSLAAPPRSPRTTRADPTGPRRPHATTPPTQPLRRTRPVRRLTQRGWSAPRGHGPAERDGCRSAGRLVGMGNGGHRRHLEHVQRPFGG